MTNIQIEGHSGPIRPIQFGNTAKPNPATFEFDLRGERFAIRRLDDRDLAEIERHFLELDPLDRSARFAGARSDAAISAYASRIDPAATVTLGAFPLTGRLIGLAEAHPTHSEGTVEIGVTVARDWQHRDIGRELVRRLIGLVFAQGARIAEFNFCPSNEAIIHVISSLGGQFDQPLGHASIRATPNTQPIGATRPDDSDRSGKLYAAKARRV